MRFLTNKYRGLMYLAAGALALGGWAYYSFNTDPTNSQSRDKSIVPGSAFNAAADADKVQANIYTTSETSPTIDSRGGALGPSDLTTIPPASRTAPNGAYQFIVPNGSFNPPGAPSQALSTFGEAMSISSDWHDSHIASTPLPRGRHHAPAIHDRARGLQFLAPAVPQRIGTLSFTGPRHNPFRHPYDLATTAKSIHHGTAIPNSLPAIRIDPESPHTATSLFTRIKTGQAVKTVL